MSSSAIVINCRLCGFHLTEERKLNNKNRNNSIAVYVWQIVVYFSGLCLQVIRIFFFFFLKSRNWNWDKFFGALWQLVSSIELIFRFRSYMRETLALTMRQTVNIVFWDYFFWTAFILIYRLGRIDALNESINGWRVVCVSLPQLLLAAASNRAHLNTELPIAKKTCIWSLPVIQCDVRSHKYYLNECTMCCFNVSESVEILCVYCRYYMMRLHHPCNGRERQRK